MTTVVKCTNKFMSDARYLLAYCAIHAAGLFIRCTEGFRTDQVSSSSEMYFAQSEEFSLQMFYAIVSCHAQRRGVNLC